MGERSADVLLRLEQVTKWHRDGRLTVERQSLAVHKGERVLIHGRSHDLTDLYRMTAGLAQPDEGSIQRYGRIAALPEVFPYLRDLTVMDYCVLPLLLGGMTRGQALERLRPVLKAGPLWDKRNVRVQFIGSYDRCMMLLLQALAAQPQLLVIGSGLYDLTYEEEKNFWQQAGLNIEQYKMAVLCFSDSAAVPYVFDRTFGLVQGILTGDER